MLPLICGVGSISGLCILDTISEKQYDLDYTFAKFTVDFAENEPQRESKAALQQQQDLLI